MNDWERMWEEDSRCDSWSNLKLALLTDFATNIYLGDIGTVDVLCLCSSVCTYFCTHKSAHMHADVLGLSTGNSDHGIWKGSTTCPRKNAGENLRFLAL